MQGALLTALDRIPDDAAKEELKAAAERFLGLAHRLSSQAANAQTAIESEIPVRGAAQFIEAADELLAGGFDIRRFHDTVLDAGAVPLDVLADRVNAWIASGKKTAAGG